MVKKLCSVAMGALLAANAGWADTVTLWTPEEQPDRIEAQERMAAAFTDKTGHEVEVVPVTEKELGTRMTAAFAAGDLPDVVYHSLQYLLPWTEAGILDAGAGTEVVEALGADTFAAGPLESANVDGDYVSVPVDGWTQMVVYRKDLFEANGLAAPDSYANIAAAIDKLHGDDIFGFVAATKTDETFMIQVLEHVFLANGYSPLVDSAENDMKLVEALEIYKKMADASPEGELYWKQSRELYFAGKAAMIIWSPFIMDELAGLRDSAPPTINDDPTSRDLASRTGFVTRVSGPSNPGGAGWADTRFMGVTADADTDAAIEFIKFSLSEGYGDILGMAAEGKFPIRRGNADDPEAYVKLWASLPVGVDRHAPLAEIYPQDVIDGIVAGLATGNRWGLAEGNLSRASKIVNSLLYNRIVREYIDGEIKADEAVARIKEEVAKID